MDRIKFYSINDLSIGHMVKLIEDILINDIDYEVSDLNDAIEAYNIIRFNKTDIKSEEWNSNLITKYDELKKILEPKIGKFFANINNENFVKNIKLLEWYYMKDFFFLFEKYNLYNRIYWSEIKVLLNQNIIHIMYLLLNKKTVIQYTTEIRQELLSDPVNAELFLHNLMPNLSGSNIKYIFPRSIGNEDVQNLFLAYINSSHPNMNYLRHIKNYPNGSSEYNISKELQYNAQLRLIELEKEVFCSENCGIKTSVEISFQEIDTIIKEEINGLNFKLTYNSKWIEENKCHQEILANFINLFQYMNRLFQINLFSKPNECSVIERASSSNLKSDYDANSVFILKNVIADLQILAYSKKLRDYDTDIEKTIEWFFKEYLVDNYNIHNFQISLSKNHNNYYEMCKSIAPEIESVAKQYQIFVEKGEVDQRYISSVNPTVIYQKIPSATKMKYAYSSSNDLENIMFLLFSNQSSLTFVPEYGDIEKSFVSLMLNRNPCIDDFEKYQMHKIEYLLDKKIIEVNRLNGTLNFVDDCMITILKNLFDYGFLCIQNYSNKYKDIIISMIADGYLLAEDTLLSKQEAAYFNYYLNSSEFSNSKDLRNKYTHGSSGTRGEINERDYYSLLKILILLILKIDDDIRFLHNTDNT